MLKFADLSVDMKSYENSLNSYMKLFPGSYMPLLIMFLSREGLLELEKDVDANSNRIILSVIKNEIADFLKDQHPLISLDEEDKIKEGEDLNEFLVRLYKKGYDASVFTTLLEMVIIDQATTSVSMVIDTAGSDDILDVKDSIMKYEPQMHEKAALLFFYLMIKRQTEIHHQKTYVPNTDREDKLGAVDWVLAFDDVLEKIQGYAGNKVWMQPKELTKLVLTKWKGGSIYNPFAGIGSYAVQLHMPCGESEYDFYFDRGVGNHYYAEEIDELSWAIGKLRLMAQYSDSDNYNLGDSSEWRGGVANNVISTPPFGLKITNEDGKQEFADHFVVRRGMDMVADGGLVACVVPLSFLSRKDTADVRKTMIDNQWLEAIAYLPANLFSYSSIRTAILFIRKEKHNRVILADGTTSFYGKGLDDEKVANLLYEKDLDLAVPFSASYYDSNCRMDEELPLSLYKKLRSVAYFDKIKKNDYSLAPGEYFSDIVPEIDGFSLIQLNKLTHDSAEPVKESGHGKIVKPSMLTSDIFSPLQEVDLEDGDFDESFNIITKDAILVSPFGNLRPTLFKYNGGKVAYRRDRLHAIYVDESKILPEYLLLELSKDYVTDQLRLKYKGDAISRLPLYDLLSVVIQCPEVKSQALRIEKDIVEERRLLHFAKLEKELFALKDKQHDDYVKMLRQRKHRIQQVMNEFAPAFSLLNECRKENGGILHDGDVVAARTGETVDSYFNKLANIVEKVENLVTNLVDKDHWDETEKIDIDDFVANIPKHHVSDKYEFQIFINKDKDPTDEVDETVAEGTATIGRFVLMNKGDLSTVFDNIIANASKWGFNEDNRRDYRIRIEVFNEYVEKGLAVRICISNNGTPIHPSVDRKRFFEWGYGSGTGIGTWQLKDIIEHYGGSIRLVEDVDAIAGFQTKYEIVLPLMTL